MRLFPPRDRLVKILIVVVALVAAWCAVLLLRAQPAADRAFFKVGAGQASRRPLIIAHQGGAGLWPGNTMYAFERAAALGVDVLEMDVQSTADGELVLIHDRTVDRLTDGRGAVNSLTLRELRALDAGYRWTPDGGRTFPFRGQGLRIPTLKEVFAAFPGALFNIELKGVDHVLIDDFCRELQAHGLADRALVASFQGSAIAEFRRQCPDMATSASFGETARFLALQKVFLAGGFSPDAQALQVPPRWGGLTVLSEDFIAAAHQRNLQVHAWTINDPAEMRRLIRAGVDGLITDFPDRLLAVAAEK